MFILISYDISDDKKRTRLAKRLKDFGPRVQKSVFEADVKTEELNKLKINDIIRLLFQGIVKINLS